MAVQSEMLYLILIPYLFFQWLAFLLAYMGITCNFAIPTNAKKFPKNSSKTEDVSFDDSSSVLEDNPLGFAVFSSIIALTLGCNTYISSENS